MATLKVKAIVLGGVNIKEKDKLITLFSLEKGKITVSMKGVRGDKAKLKSAKEIFTFGEYIIEEGRTNIVTSADIIDNFYDISKDIDKYFEGCALLGIVNDTIVEEPNPQLFIELIKALKTLCYENVRRYYVVIKFLLSVFKGMGYSFLTDNCSSCGASMPNRYFNYEIGELVCAACRNALCDKISDAAYSAMKLLNQTDYEKLTTVKLGGGGEREAFNLLCKNYKARTGRGIFRG